jgi:endonuclease YncB( thermonuclease family)
MGAQPVHFMIKKRKPPKRVSRSPGISDTSEANRNAVKVRLSDIDAPEHDQAFGRRSKQSLGSLCVL